MFGYVTPCKMELKVKDFEKFKAYYCGLCKSIKKNYGNLPRMALNYDMTFLAILLDSFQDKKCEFKKQGCIVHPTGKKVVIVNNDALDYAAFCNVSLAYYKLLDDVWDDDSIKSKIYSSILKNYIAKVPQNLGLLHNKIEEKLKELYFLEKNAKGKNIDELSSPFAELTGIILSSYNETYKDKLYWLGYNLGKWIYIIDAFDDLEKDMQKNKFNALNAAYNSSNLPYNEFYNIIADRVDFLLVSCAANSYESLESIDLIKNEDILKNILQFGLMEKMDKVFKRSENEYEKSI